MQKYSRGEGFVIRCGRFFKPWMGEERVMYVAGSRNVEVNVYEVVDLKVMSTTGGFMLRNQIVSHHFTFFWLVCMAI